MLTIRLQRRGRKNEPVFRVIVVDSKEPTKTGKQLEIVGSYDPRVDRIELNAWGPAELQRRLAEAWSGFRSFSEGWLQVRRGAGRDAVARVYRETLAGRSEPRHGHVLSLWDSAGIDPTPEA
jgi:ribosomal protein S16